MERSTTWITEGDTAQTETERILTRLVTAHSWIAVCIKSKSVFAHVIHVLTLSHPVLSSRVAHTTRRSLSTRTSRMFASLVFVYRTLWCARPSLLPPQYYFLNCLQVFFEGLSFFSSSLSFCSQFVLHIIKGSPSCPFLRFLPLNEIFFISNFLYGSVYKTMIPCTPQLDVVMYVHLIPCQHGPEDAVQLRRPSIPICSSISVRAKAISLSSSQVDQVDVALQLNSFDDLVAHQLLEASLVILSSLPA